MENELLGGCNMKSNEGYLENLSDILVSMLVEDWKSDTRFKSERDVNMYNLGISDALSQIEQLTDSLEEKPSVVTETLINQVRRTGRFTHSKNTSEYKLPSGFYKPVSGRMEWIRAKDSNDITGITGAIRRFSSDGTEEVALGLFSDGIPKEVNKKENYFMYKCDGYDIRFICKNIIEDNKNGIKIIGFTDEEVQEINDTVSRLSENI